jgi:hypothetical protein
MSPAPFACRGRWGKVRAGARGLRMRGRAVSSGTSDAMQRKHTSDDENSTLSRAVTPNPDYGTFPPTRRIPRARGN